jgi:hypothetical protein
MTRVERLEAIRKRAEAATPGPWRATQRGFGYPMFEGGPVERMSDVHALNGELMPMGRTADESKANADFVAAAREDVPWLLSELERLEKERAAAMEVGRQRVVAGLRALAASAASQASTAYMAFAAEAAETMPLNWEDA